MATVHLGCYIRVGTCEVPRVLDSIIVAIVSDPEVEVDDVCNADFMNDWGQENC